MLRALMLGGAALAVTTPSLACAQVPDLAPTTPAQAPDLAVRLPERGTADLDLLARQLLEQAQADAVAGDVMEIVAAGEARFGEAEADIREAVPFEEALAIVREALRIDPESGLLGERAQPKVTVFISFSMPDAMIDQYLMDASRFRASLVVRGLIDDDFAKTLVAINTRVQEKDLRGVGIAIDPRAFEMFGVEQVPAIVLTRTAYEHCDGEGCPPPPEFDKLLGSVSVEAALSLMAERGDLKQAARAVLNRGGAK